MKGNIPLSPLQKLAWFNLIIFGGTVLLYVVTMLVLAWSFDKPLARVAVPSMAVFALFGLSGFGGRYCKLKRDGKTLLDERDHMIAAQAWRTGMAIFWVTFVLTSVGGWALIRYGFHIQQVTIYVDFLPLTVWAGMTILMIAQSLATLHYYGWRRNDDAQ